jgi:hypothetical protein
MSAPLAFPPLRASDLLASFHKEAHGFYVGVGIGGVAQAASLIEEERKKQVPPSLRIDGKSPKMTR